VAATGPHGTTMRVMVPLGLADDPGLTKRASLGGGLRLPALRFWLDRPEAPAQPPG